MEQRILNSTKLAVTDLVQLAQIGKSEFSIDYDQEADVLYISFGTPQKADNSEQGKDGIIRRWKKKKLVGLTILNASRYKTKRNTIHS